MSTPPRPAVRTVHTVGLTAPGVVVIVLAASLFALLIDIFTGHAISWVFGVVFVLASTYAALQVRRADRAAAIITPPLVFAVLIVSYEFVSTTGGFLAKAVGGMNGLLDDGPMLWIGAGLPVLVVIYRIWQERRGYPTVRPAAPAADRSARPAEPPGSRGPDALSGPDAAPGATRTADAPPPS